MQQTFIFSNIYIYVNHTLAGLGYGGTNLTNNECFSLGAGKEQEVF